LGDKGDVMAQKYLVTSQGSIGRRHLANLRALRPDATIAVLRTKAQAGQPCLAGVDLQFYTLEEALAFRPDAAIVASPASVHLTLAEALVRAGIPVLIEKPLADSTEGVRAFAELARERQVRAGVGYNLRFLPSLVKARALVLDGSIGRVLSVRAEVGQYLPDWRPGSDYSESVSAQQKLGGGVLLELSHELDYLLWIFGAPDTVAAKGGRLGDLAIDVEDLVELCLEYEQPRRLVNVHLDFLQRAVHRSCRFIGTEGTLVWNALGDRIDLYRAATGQWEQLDYPLADRNQMYLDELTEFLGPDALDGSSLTSVAQGIDVLAVVDAARASMQTQQTVKVSQYGAS
jgi:predicted dehydrogenase